MASRFWGGDSSSSSDDESGSDVETVQRSVCSPGAAWVSGLAYTGWSLPGNSAVLKECATCAAGQSEWVAVCTEPARSILNPLCLSLLLLCPHPTRHARYSPGLRRGFSGSLVVVAPLSAHVTVSPPVTGSRRIAVPVLLRSRPPVGHPACRLLPAALEALPSLLEG